MKSIFSLIAAILLSTMTGCELVYTVRADLVEYIDTLIVRQDYAAAERILQRVDDQHPDFGELQLRLQKVHRYIQAYESGVINQARLLEEKERWPVALSMYEGGLKIFPGSERLLSEKQVFEKRYQFAIEKLEVELILNKASRLLDDQGIYEKVLIVTPNHRNTERAIKQNRAQQAEVATILVSYGQKAFHHADYAFAYQCFAVAHQLHPDDEIQKMVFNAQREQTVKEKKLAAESLNIDKSEAKKPINTGTAKKNLQKKEDTVLLRAYMEAVRSGRLHQALRYMEKLQQNQPRDVNLEKMERDLDSIIESKVEVEYDLAIRLYSQGDIEQALAVWKGVLRFDPDNSKLKSDIDRAERVLANIRRISKQQLD